MAWVPAAIAAGGELLGGLFGNSASKAEARKNREFQERMSNTAHQREVSDLKAAGLNPMLSAMRGSGASTPSGDVAHIENPARGLTANVASAVSAAREKQLVDAQVYATNAGADKSIAEMHGQELQNFLLGHELQNVEQFSATNAETQSENLKLEGQRLKGEISAQNTEEENKRLGMKMAVLEQKALALKLPSLQNEANVDSNWWGKYVRPYLGDVGKAVGTISSAAGAAAGAALGAGRRAAGGTKVPMDRVIDSKTGEILSSGPPWTPKRRSK